MTQVMSIFHNQTFDLPAEDSGRPIDYSESDIRVVFGPSPTPCSYSSLSNVDRSIGLFHNNTFSLVTSDSVRPIDYSVSDRRVTSTLSIST